MNAEDAKTTYDNMKRAVMDEVKKLFKPEFLNRIDETIVFHKLSKDDIREICGKMLDIVKERMEALGVSMTVEESAIDWLSDKGFDPIYGARPLRRTIQNEVDDAMAEMLLEGKIKSGDTVAAAVDDGKIAIRVKRD
jgi:ATP-dependent Clp protease ATP-binding subunit ClpC